MMRRFSHKDNITWGSTPAWTELYNTAAAAGATPKALLINDASFFGLVGADLQGWADAWPGGYNAAELVNPPSVVAGVPTFAGTEYMDWDTTGIGMAGNMTYLLGIKIKAGTAANDRILSNVTSRGVYNRAGNWGLYDGVTTHDTTVSLDVGNLHAVSVQCKNGSPIRVHVEGVYAGQTAGNYAQYDIGNTSTLMARGDHANIGEADIYFAGLFAGASDAISAAVGLWGKAYLGL
jgi:hypothetical protein